VLTDDPAALLAALDRQLAHLEWLAEECGFEEMAVDSRCDIAMINGVARRFNQYPRCCTEG